jgi:hypothetical protein
MQDAHPDDDEQIKLTKLKARMCVFLDGELTAQLNCLEAELAREELLHNAVKKQRLMDRLKALLPDFIVPKAQ